jgi:hypothetical protein
MNTLKHLALAAALLLAAGCDDEKPATADAAVPAPDGGMMMAGPDGGTTPVPDGGPVTPDGGGVTGDAGGASTLVELVNGIIKNTNETALPTTIDDKTVTDTMDPAAFDSLF